MQFNGDVLSYRYHFSNLQNNCVREVHRLDVAL